MSAVKLSDTQMAAHLAHLPEWKNQDQVISRRYRFPDFARALEFVNAVGRAAEDIHHHPDIDIRYDTVVVSLTTHDAGGLTGLDMELAALADSAADAVGGA